MNAPNLFDSEPAFSRAGTVEGPLFLTNAPNLNHFLSLGYLGPFEAFGPQDLYYADLLVEVPGRLPLFRGPLHEQVVTHVQRESPRTTRAVILELDPEYLPDESVPVYDAHGDISNKPLTSPDWFLAAPPLVLPLTSVRRLHFLSEDDRDEVLARRFDNVPPIRQEWVSVKPTLIDNRSFNLEAVLSWLSDYEKPKAPTQEAFREADRVAGAVALAAHYRPDLAKPLLAIPYADHLDERLPNWFDLLRSDLPDQTLSDPDALIFASAVSILRSTSLTKWRPREILEEVWRRVVDHLPEEETDYLEKGFDRIRRILNNEEEFTASRSQRYPALQGLMLLLIREKPTHLLQWDPKETHAGETAHLTAALYAGLLYGHARLPLSLRDTETDRRIAEDVARHLSSLPLPTPALKQSAKKEKSAKQDLAGLLLSADLEAEGPYRRAALELCAALDWRDCVTSMLICPNDDPVTMDYVMQKRKVVRFRVPGFAELTHDLNVERFRERLQAQTIPDRVEKRLLRTLIYA